MAILLTRPWYIANDLQGVDILSALASASVSDSDSGGGGGAPVGQEGVKCSEGRVTALCIQTNSWASEFWRYVYDDMHERMKLCQWRRKKKIGKINHPIQCHRY